MDGYDLPKGWYKEEVIRKSGLSAGKTDIYYYGPDGKKYRSKPQIARELGSNCDLTPFDFKSGNMMSHSTGIIRRTKGKKTAYDFSKGFRGDISLALPVRQTASIFKQPVTVIRSHPDSQVRHDLKHGPPDSTPPRQLFWERSLTGLTCGDIDEEALKCITLPNKIKGIGPELSTENLLQSIAAALHINSNSAVVGQSQSTTKFAKNPTVYINTNQPLIQQVVITDDDIRQQESKVEGARKKLEELLAALEKSNRENLLKDDRPLSADPSESTSEDVAPASPLRPSADLKGEGRSRKRKTSPNRSPDQEEGLSATGDEPPAAKQANTQLEEKQELERDGATGDATEPSSSSSEPSSSSARSVGDVTEPSSARSVGDVTEPSSARSVGDVTEPSSARSVGDVTEPSSARSVGDVTEPSSARSVGDVPTPKINQISDVTATTDTKGEDTGVQATLCTNVSADNTTERDRTTPTLERGRITTDETEKPADLALETKEHADLGSEIKEPADLASETKEPADPASKTKEPAVPASETKESANLSSVPEGKVNVSMDTS